MNILAIVLVLVFSTVLCIIEVPKMLKDNHYKELWTFSILLALGTVLAILKSLSVDLPNPSDLIAWVYSPIEDFLKNLLK